MIETEFTRMVGVNYPIIGAPMFLVSYEELTIAVAQAGGMGSFPLPNYRTTQDLKAALSYIRKETDKPIGVNINLHKKFDWKDQLALCLDAGVKFFITSLGDPGLILDDVHGIGGIVFTDVISLEQGLKARDRGVDGLVAVAAGAGGHAGTIPTIILAPYLKEKVGIPIIAAGGISTGAQMAAAMALGACAVVVGTRLIATTESKADSEYKKAVIASGPRDIIYTDKITGKHANWIASSIEGYENYSAGLKAWSERRSAGQSVAQTEEIKPAGVVIREMVSEFESVCERMGEFSTAI